MMQKRVKIDYFFNYNLELLNNQKKKLIMKNKVIEINIFIYLFLIIIIVFFQFFNELLTLLQVSFNNLNKVSYVYSLYIYSSYNYKLKTFLISSIIYYI